MIRNERKVDLLNPIAFFKRLFSRISAKKAEKNGLFYVNGPDVLPAPLSAEEEAEVLCRLDTDEDARPFLVEHNLRLVVYIAKRFENTGIGIEDLVSIGTSSVSKI